MKSGSGLAGCLKRLLGKTAAIEFPLFEQSHHLINALRGMLPNVAAESRRRSTAEDPMASLSNAYILLIGMARHESIVDSDGFISAVDCNLDIGQGRL